jgi:cell division protein FtsW
MTSTAAKARASGSRFARVRHWFGRFESPTTTYYLLLATTAILVVFGLIMVLSASMPSPR